MSMKDDVALAQLEALVKIPGSLRIITVDHICGGGRHPGDPGFDNQKCDSFAFPLTDHRHFRKEDVLRIEGPNHRGQYTAFSENARTVSFDGPAALLHRLLEAGDEG